MMFTGVVLAGGRSSRMGRDKALLPYRGTSLLDHAIATLREAGAAHVIVSGDRPTHGGVPDAQPYAGPVGAIASVVRRCDDGPIVVVPVDMPMLDAAALRRLREALETSNAAHFTGHPLPWAACVDAKVRDALSNLMQRQPEGPSMRALHAAIDGIEVDAANAETLRNINTPADWESIHP